MKNLILTILFALVVSFSNAQSYAIIRQNSGTVWTNENPLITRGEFGWDITNKRLKIGNGIDRWNTLPYFLNQTDSTGGGGTGPAGPTGPAGADGLDGNTVLSGTGDPSPSDGVDGDFYISDTWYIFGPKASGSWPLGVYLIGADGSNGTNGTDGSVWRDGSGAPSSGLGVNGDYYLNDATGDVYLKSAGTYSIVANITGPPGSFTPAALSKVDDTNVTLTLGGTPLTALLQATTITAGWSGTLAYSRGGTGLSTLGTANQLLRINAGGTALEYYTPTYIVPGDTNAMLAPYAELSEVNAKKEYIVLSVGCASTATTSAGATTYFANNPARGLQSNSTRDRFICPVTGTITAVYLWGSWGNSPSANSHQFYVRDEDLTTDYTITTTASLSGVSNLKVSNSSMSGTVNAGDLLSMKWITPGTWTTTATNVIWSGYVVIELNIH